MRDISFWSKKSGSGREPLGVCMCLCVSVGSVVGGVGEGLASCAGEGDFDFAIASPKLEVGIGDAHFCSSGSVSADAERLKRGNRLQSTTHPVKIFTVVRIFRIGRNLHRRGMRCVEHSIVVGPCNRLYILDASAYHTVKHRGA